MESKRYTAPDQIYTKDLLAEWREKYNIIFDPKWCHGIRVIPREGYEPLFELLGEDDGTLFSYSRPVLFSSVWATGIQEALDEAIKYSISKGWIKSE